MSAGSSGRMVDGRDGRVSGRGRVERHLAAGHPDGGALAARRTRRPISRAPGATTVGIGWPGEDRIERDLLPVG